MSAISKSYIPEKFHFCSMETRYYGSRSYLRPVSESDSANKRILDGFDSKDGKNVVKTIFENKPMSGFRITNHYSEWRIQDPRGFYIEVTQESFNNLISKCIIDHGEIVSKCVWGWNKKAILISEDFPEYSAAKKNSEQVKGKLSELKIGSRFNFNLDQSENIYLGKYYSKNEVENYSIYNIYQDNDSYYRKNYIPRNSDINVTHLYYDVNRKSVNEIRSRSIFNIKDGELSEEDLKKHTDSYKNYISSNSSRPFQYLEIQKAAFSFAQTGKGKDTLSQSKYFNNSRPYLRDCKFLILHIEGKFYILQNKTGREIVSSYREQLDLNSNTFLQEIDLDKTNKKLEDISFRNKSYSSVLSNVEKIGDPIPATNKFLLSKVFSFCDIITKIK